MTFIESHKGKMYVKWVGFSSNNVWLQKFKECRRKVIITKNRMECAMPHSELLIYLTALVEIPKTYLITVQGEYDKY